MTTLQQELLSLKSQFENVDSDDPSSREQRLIITTKLEDLRREFRELLIKLQERQCELSGMIPSDEEDEMDPHVRVRLRSASVASKISLRSNDQRLLSARYRKTTISRMISFNGSFLSTSSECIKWRKKREVNLPLLFFARVHRPRKQASLLNKW